jgi:hypothetical protein
LCFFPIQRPEALQAARAAGLRVVPSGGPAAQDWVRLGAAVDEFRIMT